MLSLSNLRTGLLSLVLLLGFSAHSSHFNSGEIYYRWAPTASDTSRYEVFVNWYRNTAGIPLTQNNQTVCISSSCFPNINATLSRDIPPLSFRHPTDTMAWLVDIDSCADLSDPGYKDVAIHRFRGFVHIPGLCGDFTFSANAVCCRDASTNLMLSSNIHLEARLNNTLGQTSSAEFLSSPNVALCLQPNNPLPTRFFQSAFDPEGDLINYEFGRPLSGVQCGPSTPIPYDSGYTAVTAIPSSMGMQIDQSNGRITLRPTQQGSYVLKINVKSFGFDTLNLVLVETSSASREIQVPVTASCNPLFFGTGSASLRLKSGTYIPIDYTQSELDSMESAYQVNQILRDSGQVTTIPYLNGYNCGDSSIFLEFQSQYDWSGISPTDFRLIGPDSNLLPVVQVLPLYPDSNSNLVGGVELKLLQGFNRNGNYLLQIRRGNDNNTFYNSCENAVGEFLSMLLPISGCSGIGLAEWPASWWVSNMIMRNKLSQGAAFRVHAPNFDGHFELSIYNQVGQKVHHDSQFPNRGHWDADGLSAGIYIYQLESRDDGPKYLQRGRLIVLD